MRELRGGIIGIGLLAVALELSAAQTRRGVPVVLETGGTGTEELTLLHAECYRGSPPNSTVKDEDDFTCAGNVRNTGTAVISSAKVHITLFNRAGENPGEDGVRIETLPLRVGKTSAFELVYYVAPKNVSRVSMRFETFDERRLRSKDARPK